MRSLNVREHHYYHPSVYVSTITQNILSIDIKANLCKNSNMFSGFMSAVANRSTASTWGTGSFGFFLGASIASTGKFFPVSNADIICLVDLC